MPDILTHLLVTHLFVRVPNLFKNKLLQFYYDHRSLIYLGAILPDLVSKPFQFISMSYYNFALPFHSPFCIILVCAIISQFLYIKNRNVSFIVLLSFSMLHILVDSFKKGVNPGYQVLFPFSLKRYGFSLISSEMFMIILVVLVILVILIELYMLVRIKAIKVY
jgi:hypothetical protein